MLAIRDMPAAASRHGRRRLLDAQLADLVAQMAPDIAVVEEVHALPRQGVVSTFTFGVSFGVVRGVLAPRRIGAAACECLQARNTNMLPASGRQRFFHIRPDFSLASRITAGLTPHLSPTPTS